MRNYLKCLAAIVALVGLGLTGCSRGPEYATDEENNMKMDMSQYETPVNPSAPKKK